MEFLNQLLAFGIFIFGALVCFGAAIVIHERNEFRHKEKIQDELNKDTQ